MFWGLCQAKNWKCCEMSVHISECPVNKKIVTVFHRRAKTMHRFCVLASSATEESAWTIPDASHIPGIKNNAEFNCYPTGLQGALKPDAISRARHRMQPWSL